jgi:hypothetical protein
MDFAQHFLQSLLRMMMMVREEQLAREECNKYDLTAGPCPGGLLLVVSHLFRVLVFSFMECASRPHTPANTPFH